MSSATHERTPARESTRNRDAAPVSNRLLQRRCACGASGGSCEECRKNRLQRRASAAGPAPDAAPLVDEVIGGTGKPLDGAARSFFERGFGHDFSAVRIHDDDRAARSVREVGAIAYTVGRHLAFDQGHYAPSSAGGRRLIAHELAHMVQQNGGAGGAAVQRSSISPETQVRMGPEDDGLEREADRAADEVMGGGRASLRAAGASALRRKPWHPGRQPAIVGLDEAGPDADLTGGTEDTLYDCMKGAKADPDECSPPRALTWADFSGAAKAKSAFSAETFAPVTDKPMDPTKASCLQRVLGKSTDETRVFQALFDGKKSWGNAQFRDPTNTKLTGCAKGVKPCVDFFKEQKKAGLKGGEWKASGTPSAKCPASAVAATVTAKNQSDCAGIETACTAAAVQESERLLAHEQGHFDISCAIAKKANSALATGSKLKDIKEGVAKKNKDTQKKYDDDTDHGCKAGDQATWAGEISKGLPKVAIP